MEIVNNLNQAGEKMSSLKSIRKEAVLLVFMALMTNSVFSEPYSSAIDIFERIAEINISNNEDEKEAQYRTLLDNAVAYRDANKEEPEAWIASALARMSLARYEGMSALGAMKTARKELEQAISLDQQALNGYGPALLGRLYLVMLGWPISFGSDKKAKKYIDEATAISDSSIENIYYQGLYLVEKKKFREAKDFLLKAKAMPDYSNRPIWSASVKKSIGEALANVEQKLKK